MSDTPRPTPIEVLLVEGDAADAALTVRQPVDPKASLEAVNPVEHFWLTIMRLP
jgi:hypothetical protein